MGAARDVPRLPHLAQNRAAILERSAIAAFVGLVPLPYVDDLLASAVRGTLLRKLADSRQVDATDGALDRIASVARGGGLRGASTSVRGASRVTSRLFGLRGLARVASGLQVLARADELAGTFAVATLFDHYCARHHVGLGLDRARGERLAAAIAQAIGDARVGLGRRGVRRLGGGARQALLSGPRAAVAVAERALRFVPLLPAPVAEPELVTPPDAPPAGAAGAPRGNLLVRGAHSLGELLRDAGATWVEELTLAFDARWAAEAGG